MAFSLDIFHRHYAHRPVFYHTILSRMVSFYSLLEDIFRELRNLRDKIKRFEGGQEEMHRYLLRLEEGIVCIKEIANDINTLIYRDQERVRKEFKRIIMHLDRALKHEKTLIAHKTRILGKALSRRQVKEADEKQKRKVEAQIVLLKNEIESESRKKKQATEIRAEMRKKEEQKVSLLRHLAHQLYLAAKSHDRDAFSPAEAAREFDLKNDNRVIRLVIRRVIEKDHLNKSINRIEKDLSKFRFNDREKWRKEHQKMLELDEKEVKGMNDLAWAGSKEFTLLHRLEFYLRWLSVSFRHNKPRFESVYGLKEGVLLKEETKFRHRKDIIFEQSKELMNEFG